jgi:hypothetical protein
MRIGCSRRGVCNAGRRYDAGLEASCFRILQQRRQLVLQRSRAVVVTDRTGYADEANAGFFTRQNGRHGPRTVGYLTVRIVGFDERNIGEALERQGVFLAWISFSLAGIDPRGRHRADAHAVTQKQNDILWTFGRLF